MVTFLFLSLADAACTQVRSALFRQVRCCPSRAPMVSAAAKRSILVFVCAVRLSPARIRNLLRTLPPFFPFFALKNPVVLVLVFISFLASFSRFCVCVQTSECGTGWWSSSLPWASTTLPWRLVLARGTSTCRCIHVHLCTFCVHFCTSFCS